MSRQPKSQGDDQRKHLQSEIAARPRDDAFPDLFHPLIKSCSAKRSRAPSILSVTFPPMTKATVPSCSEIMIATQSVSSVTPSAARCRVPQVFRRLGLVLSGSRQRTAV